MAATRCPLLTVKMDVPAPNAPSQDSIFHFIDHNITQVTSDFAHLVTRDKLLGEPCSDVGRHPTSVE